MIGDIISWCGIEGPQNKEDGGGSVKIALPFIDKKMVLNSADLINFKNYMLRK